MWPNNYFVTENVTQRVYSTGTGVPTDLKIEGFVQKHQIDTRLALEAIRWRQCLTECGFELIDAFPGESGEILVSAIFRNLCFEVIVENDGLFTATFEKDNAIVSEAYHVGLVEAKSMLNEAVLQKWILSAGFTLTDLTPTLTGSQASVSETPVLMAPYP